MTENEVEVLRKQNMIRNTVELQEEGKPIAYVGEAFGLYIPPMFHFGEYDFFGKARLSKSEGNRRIWMVESGQEDNYFIYQGKLVADLNELVKKDQAAGLGNRLGELLLGSLTPRGAVSYRIALKHEAKRQQLNLEDQLLQTVFGPIDLVIMNEYDKAKYNRFSIA